MNSFTHTQVLALDSPVIRVPTGFAGIMSAICDIAIVIALCYYLQSGRSGFAKYVDTQISLSIDCG